MRFSIEHETRLEFSAPVYEHHCELRFSPRPGPHHRVIATRLEIQPAASFYTYTDAFGNVVHTFDLLEPHQSLVTRAISEVDTTLGNPFEFELLSPEQEARWYKRQLKSDPFLYQYLIHRSPVVPNWQALDLGGLPAAPAFDRTQSAPFSLIKAMEWVASALRYRPGASDTHQPLQDVVRERTGVCQDFAHLLLSLVRSWGLPARYVMGYMDAPADPRDGASANAATHAWTEVLVAGAGWRGYDATHGLCANDLYIPFAVGRDSFDAAPQRGTFKGVGVTQSQRLRVQLDRRQAVQQ